MQTRKIRLDASSRVGFVSGSESLFLRAFEGTSPFSQMGLEFEQFLHDVDVL